MDCFQQCGAKSVPRKTTVNDSKSRSTFEEGDTPACGGIRMTLQTPFSKSDVELKQVLFQIELIQDRN